MRSVSSFEQTTEQRADSTSIALSAIRAFSVQEFCCRYGIGRSKTYEEIRAGRLRARKAGKRTIITEDDAEDWLRKLPVVPRS